MGSRFWWLPITLGLGYLGAQAVKITEIIKGRDISNLGIISQPVFLIIILIFTLIIELFAMHYYGGE